MSTNTKRRKRNLYQIIGIVLFVLVGWLGWNYFVANAGVSKVSFSRIGRSESVTFKVEVVKSTPDRRRGLMFRRSMARDQGMLFIFPAQAERSFWMKDTLIPLDMVFVDQDLTVVGTLENVPINNEQQRRISAPSKIVLELNAGVIKERGIQVGDKLALDTAILRDVS